MSKELVLCPSLILEPIVDNLVIVNFQAQHLESLQRIFKTDNGYLISYYWKYYVQFSFLFTYGIIFLTWTQLKRHYCTFVVILI